MYLTVYSFVCFDSLFISLLSLSSNWHGGHRSYIRSCQPVPKPGLIFAVTKIRHRDDVLNCIFICMFFLSYLCLVTGMEGTALTYVAVNQSPSQGQCLLSPESGTEMMYLTVYSFVCFDSLVISLFSLSSNWHGGHGSYVRSCQPVPQPGPVPAVTRIRHRDDVLNCIFICMF